MGLQCSILGHAFEDAGVEREREEKGSEVITTEREIERCRRCGTERVIAENTEVTAIVDGEAVGLESEFESADATEQEGGSIIAAIERSGSESATSVEIGPDEGTAPTSVSGQAATGEAAAAASAAEAGATDEEGAEPDQTDESAPEPEAEDAEILTETDEPNRPPGEWPDDPDQNTGEEEALEAEEAKSDAETETSIEIPEEESLSGITVPDGQIVCPNCGFQVDAQSGYRKGDSCPKCNAWLEAERNQ